MIIDMDQTNLCESLTLLIGYLLSSADCLYDEPQGYGPFRLLDAARRVLNIMKDNNLSTPFHVGLLEQIEKEITSMKSDQETRTMINNFILRYTKEMKKTLPTSNN